MGIFSTNAQASSPNSGTPVQS